MDALWFSADTHFCLACLGDQINLAGGFIQAFGHRAQRLVDVQRIEQSEKKNYTKYQTSNHV